MRAAAAITHSEDPRRVDPLPRTEAATSPTERGREGLEDGRFFRSLRTVKRRISAGIVPRFFHILGLPGFSNASLFF